MQTECDLAKGFRLGPWTIVPENGEISDGAQAHRLEPKVMDVLTSLARHAGTLVTKQTLIDEVWNGRAVTDEVIARCISALRTHLGDDHKAPSYIETLPKRGYRLLAAVEPLHAEAPISAPEVTGSRRRGSYLLLAVAVIAIGYLAVRLLSPAPQPEAFESVAVLPFTNLSASPDQYLADGVTEELTYTLTQLPDLKVAARTSAFQFRDTALDVREIGRRIEVDGIIEGSVRREKDRLRVTAQFADTRTGYQLWAVTFDGSVQDVFRLQRQVAERVRDSIRGNGRAPEPNSVTEPANFAAYDLYLRGRYALNRRGADSLERAAGLFREAIALDPGYGPAYLELANALSLLPSYSSEHGDSMYEDATRIANNGVQADPSISEAAAALQGYIHNKRGEWLEADRAYQTALRAHHVESTTHQWYSNMLASVGRMEEALEQAQRARRLDPLSPVVMSRLAMTSLWNNDLKAAERQFTVANELGIKSRLHLESQLLLMIREGRLDEARLLARDPESGTAPEWLEALLDCLGSGAHCDVTEAALKSDEAVSARVQLVAWALLGRLDKVGEIAGRLEQDIGAFETELLFIAELEGFRRLPQFQRLLEAIGISDYWEQIGCRWSEAGVRCEGLSST